MLVLQDQEVILEIEDNEVYMHVNVISINNCIMYYIRKEQGETEGKKVVIFVIRVANVTVIMLV